MNAVWTNLARRISAFRRASAGNVAITFALATLPIVGTVGFAVDYSHANAVKAAMQAALDSTALMLSKDAATLSNADLQTKAKSYFEALFTRPEAKNIVVSAAYSATGGSKVKVDGAADVPTSFLGVIGYQNINVNGSSTAAWGSTRLRVALALDNTGSMSSDGKMTALKAATKTLLTQLKGTSSQNDDVYVSIIPFAEDVNIGSNNYNASWIDWKEWDEENTTTTCTGRRGRTCKTVSLSHNQWNGCVADRGGYNGPTGQDYDQNVTAPGSSASSKFPADQDDNCPQQIMGLSNNWTAMDRLVDNMYPAGSTNQPIGLVWAWQSLVGGGPLTAPAKDSNYKYTDVIVLMSDGLNTKNRWDGNGFSVSPEVDKRMYDAGRNGDGTCANIKNAGIPIYTVQVNTGGDPTSTLMQNCAGSPDKFIDPSKFYMVTTANGLSAVFSAIGTNLTKLRVAQ
jgi:Flp pilus assembly protein TadG